MAFKSDKQRKKVMSMLNSSSGNNTPRILKNSSYKQLKRKGINLDPNKDSDKDGVKNKNDCKPLDPKKQGILHDFQIKRLRKMEAKLEAKKNKELKKLEAATEILKEKQSIASKKADIQRIKFNKKQSVIDEVNREKKTIRDLKEANKAAKQQLFKLSVTGKTVGKSKQVIGATKAFLNKKSTKRTLKKIGKIFNV